MENTQNTLHKHSTINFLYLLNNENYRTFNVVVARKLGSINAALMLNELVQRYEYHLERNELYSDQKNGGGWFYYTCEKGEERLCMSRIEQDNAINALIKAGLVEKKTLGLPAKRHFRILQENLVEFLNSKKHSSLSETDKQESMSPTTQFVENRQTAPYIKEYQEENHLRTTTTKPPPKVEATPKVASGGDGEKLEQPLHGINYKTPKGTIEHIDENRIFQHFLRSGYSTQTIQEAIGQARENKYPIREILRWLEKACQEIHSRTLAPAPQVPQKKPREVIKEKTMVMKDFLNKNAKLKMEKDNA